MKYTKTLLLAACLALSASAQSAELDEQLAARDGWSSWSVPAIAEGRTACCFAASGFARSATQCNLDSRQFSWGTSSDATPAANTGLRIFAHASNGKVDRLRALAEDCPVSADSPIRSLDPVAATDTLMWLDGQVRGNQLDKDPDAAIAAMSMLALPAATDRLVALLDATVKQERRESALFWLALNRGAAGAAQAQRVARDDADSHMRSHALFALSQSPQTDRYDRIRDIGLKDRDREVRGQALFWMTQTGDPRAAADILDTLQHELDAEVREQAVFALSQLPDEQADAQLIALVRGNFPREAKQRALFWLGQSGSEQALAFLDAVISPPVGK